MFIVPEKKTCLKIRRWVVVGGWWRNKTRSAVLDRVKYDDTLPIKARTERGEIIMHYKKHGVFVLVVLMLHQHKTQREKKKQKTG